MDLAPTARDFATYQRETVRHLLERQAGVFALMLSLSLALDAWRLHPSAEFATILQRLPAQIVTSGFERSSRCRDPGLLIAVVAGDASVPLEQ